MYQLPGLSLIVFLAIFLTGCDTDREEGPLAPPNILWINCEDIGPNIGAFGDSLAVTPNLDRLAAEGVRFTRAYATAPICSPSRSALITGLYATALGTQHLRCTVELPDSIKAFPEYLKEGGYFVTNYAKTDYNFDPSGLYDYHEQDFAPWRQRTREDQPFFSYFVFGMTHEGPTNDFSRWAEQVKDLPDALRHSPDRMHVPPYHPDTEAFRTIWAHYYDNISLMDMTVGRVLDSLERDGLAERTIVFFFSDHGAGLPRYKRWLNHTGLHVPVIVYAPPRYRDWLTVRPGQAEDRLISFVDFAPTVMNLAGSPIPASMQGRPFLGPDLPEPKEYVFGARSRADNMYEISRSVTDGRYFYVRHYYPHLPYIQPGIIFSGMKASYAELIRMKQEGSLPEQSARLYEAKPVEELYDLEADPEELVNLARDPAYQEMKESLRERMHTWMLDHLDTGMLPEAEYMLRAQGSNPYDMVRDPEKFDAPRLLAAMELVGKADIGRFLLNLKDADSGVRYWAVIGLQAVGEAGREAIPDLLPLLDDPSPAVQIAVAETLCRLGSCSRALPVLVKWADDDRLWIALFAARSIELLGNKACGIVPDIHRLLNKHAAEPGSNIRTRDYNFSAFIYWSLEYALLNCGIGEEPESLY